MTNDRPEVVITPSMVEYEQLAADLQTLREAGTESNTAAIVAAVRAQAQDARWQGVTALRQQLVRADLTRSEKLEILDRYDETVIAVVHGRQPGRSTVERLRSKHDGMRATWELNWAAFARELLLSEVS